MLLRLAATLLILLPPLAVSGQEPTPSPKGQDPPAAGKIDFTLMATLRVRFQTPQGDPIADVSVKPYAMRGKENRSGHGYWNTELIGPPQSTISNDQGEALVRYPVNIGSPTEPMTTGEVSIIITHPEFVRRSTHLPLVQEEHTVTLQPGCEVIFTAKDPANRPTSEFAVLMAGPNAATLWKPAEGGGLRTGAATEGQWQTLLVKPQNDGPTLFSNVLPLRVRPKQALNVRGVPLKPGLVVSGRLPDEAPRPIRKGHVLLVSAPKPAGPAFGEDNPSIVWYDWAPIDEQGGFQFDSVPRGGVLQLLAYCDGWMSKTTFPEAGVFHMGERFEAPEEGRLEVVLQVEPTGVAEITVLDPQGRPLTEGTIAAWPNQRLLLGGSQLLGERPRSLDGMRRQLDPDAAPAPSDAEKDFPYMVKLNEQGKARLSGLPLMRSHSLALQHPSLVLPGNAAVMLTGPEPFSQEFRAISSVR